MLTRIVPSLELMEADSYRKQQTSFCVLTLFVIAILLLLHTLFASLLGEPSTWVIVLLGFSFSLKIVELVWLQGQTHGITKRTARLETGLSIAGIFLLAALLSLLTNRDVAPYFVLLAIPILQCAYHFGLVPTIITIGAAVGLIFFWMHYFFLIHPPPLAAEYLEAGMISIIYILMGLLVWFLVHQLKLQQRSLSENMVELESARERLIREEKLAAVGRLASGIAHEIRNPVAMILSSLTTATNRGIGEVDREEMIQIAAKESSRLEHLTEEFLRYARPTTLQRSSILVSDLLIYTAEVVRAHAAMRSIEVVCLPMGDQTIEIDSAQVQGALLNLVLNGIDATPTPGTIELKAARDGTFIRIDVQNSGSAIPESVLPSIFEPFYSTKPKGAGLGLAIARRVAQDHGGDLWVSCNENGRVIFSITLEAGGVRK